MLQPLQNLEVTKTINLSWAELGRGWGGGNSSALSFYPGPKASSASTASQTNRQKRPQILENQSQAIQGCCDLQACSKNSGKSATRSPWVWKWAQMWMQSGIWGFFFWRCLWWGCVQTKSFQAQINPTAKGLAFPMELLSPEQLSVALE